MTQKAAFTGSLPDIYETRLVPLVFKPFAVDLSERIARKSPQRILELAAGTGALTRELLERLPRAEIVATDVSQAMLDGAGRQIKNDNVRFDVCDASALSYGDNGFDAVVAQFGVMFFPDKPGAYKHVHRVLAEKGTFTFNVWNIIQKNPMANVIAKAFRAAAGQPSFLERVPFGYVDQQNIASQLREAGFHEVDAETIAKTAKAPSPAGVLEAFVSGTPFGDDFAHLGRDKGAQVREAIFEALVDAFGDGEFENVMSAVVFEAQKN
jgi:ubiquinone/menaquinone biosynthesis C-methylase UbiE